MWGVSVLISAELKIRQLLKNKITKIILESKFKECFLLNKKFINIIPQKIIASKALVNLVLPSEKGLGYSRPNRYPDIFNIILVWSKNS